MGAHLGHDPCILTVLRFSARYRRAAQLEEGYGILTTPLERLVMGLRVSAEEETEGLDLGEHGAEAYPDFHRAG